MQTSSLTMRKCAITLVLIGAATGCSYEQSESTAPSKAITDPVSAAKAVAADEIAGDVIVDADPEADDAQDIDVKVLSATLERGDEDPSSSAKPANASADPARLAVVGVPRGVNMRSGPGGEHSVIVGVEKHRILTATGNESDGWTEVQIDGQTGWVSSSHLQVTTAVDVATEPATTVAVDPGELVAPIGEARVLVVSNVDAGVNLRSGPGVEYAVVTGAPVGSTVIATGNESLDWLEVEHAGLTGWASARYFIAR